MTAYQIQVADGGYPTPGSRDRVADNNRRAEAVTDWQPATVCGIGQFDSAETAALVIKDQIHNYAPLAHAGEIALDKRILRAVAVEILGAGASRDDYERAREQSVGGPVRRPVEVPPEVFHVARTAGIEDYQN